MSRYRNRYDDYYSYFPASKSKGERMADAEKKRKALEKKGAKLSPVRLPGFAITTTLWGKAWCKNIESYQDYSNRLPRGRSYVRSNSIIDLQIKQGHVTAQVMGSSLYRINIRITPVSKDRWTALSTACAGKIGSLVELLQGRISDEVMSVMTNPDNGLFPKPPEITLKCSCPDSARLCKHLAAALYGIGNRLDTMPELLFLLRGVDAADLIDQAVEVPSIVAESDGALGDDELSDVFGVDIDLGTVSSEPKKRGRPRKESPKAKVKVAAKSTGRSRHGSSSKASFGKAFEKQLRKLTTSPPPADCSRWTLNLLREELIARKIVTAVSVSTIHNTLKKLKISLT